MACPGKSVNMEEKPGMIPGKCRTRTETVEISSEHSRSEDSTCKGPEAEAPGPEGRGRKVWTEHTYSGVPWRGSEVSVQCVLVSLARREHQLQ